MTLLLFHYKLSLRTNTLKGKGKEREAPAVTDVAACLLQQQCTSLVFALSRQSLFTVSQVCSVINSSGAVQSEVGMSLLRWISTDSLPLKQGIN